VGIPVHHARLNLINEIFGFYQGSAIWLIGRNTISPPKAAVSAAARMWKK
jgi:hypothetical protein